MQLIVKGRHLQLTESLKQYVDEKIGAEVDHILNRPAIKVEVELSDELASKGGTDKECRVTLAVPRGKTLVITEVADDMYAAIDLAKDRLSRALKRELERRREGRKDKADLSAPAPEEGEDYVD